MSMPNVLGKSVTDVHSQLTGLGQSITYTFDILMDTQDPSSTAVRTIAYASIEGDPDWYVVKQSPDPDDPFADDNAVTLKVDALVRVVNFKPAAALAHHDSWIDLGGTVWWHDLGGSAIPPPANMNAGAIASQSKGPVQASQGLLILVYRPPNEPVDD